MRTRILLISALAGVVAALAGVYTGRWISELKGDREFRESIRGHETTLARDQTIPDLTLLTPQLSETTLHRALQGQAGLILLVSSGCDACRSDLKRWAAYAKKHPREVPLWVISDEPVSADTLAGGQGEFPFLVYSDANGTFRFTYQVRVYPTIIGVDSQAVIRLIHQGSYAAQSPVKIVRAFKKSLPADDSST